MSKEYKEHIEREDAKTRLRMWITDCVLDGDNEAADCFRDCIDLLDSIPAADVAPAVELEDLRAKYQALVAEKRQEQWRHGRNVYNRVSLWSQKRAD